ncbi:MAG TPA: carboxymuconolactone decarboxylase family protein [Bacteroidales bacterium]|nr:carboxymuconolactone decarboxylase family protein [Bacteroidales bacterium]
MENFKYLDSKTIELAGIAASIAGGCRPCLDYHFKKAIKVGCTVEQVKESVELGKMIKQRPIKDIYEHAENLFSNSKKKIICEFLKNPEES